MKITFASRELEKLCNRSNYSIRKLGDIGARKLQNRLADIEAAHDVTELITGTPHPLKGNREGDFSLRLHGAQRLVFRPAHIPPPRLEDRGIDWQNVTAVQIVEIGNYHDT
jgi:proteic killer suppression protein